MNRREFTRLAFASAVTTSTHVLSSQEDYKPTDNERLFSAYDDSEGKHYITRLDVSENDLIDLKNNSLEIPFRAHDTLPLSAQKSLSFGRRPHNQMITCDFRNQQTQIIKAKNGRHFYGHGCIHQGSNTLFTTENDYDGNNGKSRGVIGLRDALSFAQIGEYESYGVGPHDIHLMPDNKTIVVANGGIQTHPDFGRRKLNIKSMQPSLVFIDIGSGKKIDEYRLPDHQLSIRHLAITPKGEIGIATQYQGSFTKDVPNYLLAWFGPDGLETLNDSVELTRSCKGYIADVAVDLSSQILAASSPRGNNVSFWDINDSRLIGTVTLSAPSGISFDDRRQRFLVSNEEGAVYGIDIKYFLSTISTSDSDLVDHLSIVELGKFPVKWDNHMFLYS